MSDFLTRLATRSLHRAQTISPRLASVFEPVQAPATSLQSAVTERSDTAVVSDHPAPTAAPEVASSAPVIPGRRVGAADGVLDWKGAAPVAQTELISTAERVLDPRLTGMKRPPLDPPPRTSELTNQGPGALDMSFPRTGNTLGTQDGATPQVPPLKPAAADAASPPALAPVLEQRHLLVAAEPLARLELGNFAIVARADRDAAKTSHRPESSFTAAEPSVQVTIGRIEVRAEKEPARSARAAPAARAKPLEDYLRERSRRGSQ